MKLEGTWCTEDIDDEHLQLRVFSSTTEENSVFKFCNERYVIFFERPKKISKKKNVQVTFYKSLGAFLQNKSMVL